MKTDWELWELIVRRVILYPLAAFPYVLLSVIISAFVYSIVTGRT